MRSTRRRAGLVAAGAALVVGGGVGLSPTPHAEAVDEHIDEHVDLGGLACLHLGAHLAIPEGAGDPLAVAVERASLGPARCSA